MRNPLRWLLCFAFLHGLWYASITLPWQSPDEDLHYEYMRILEEHHTLNPTAALRSSEVQWSIADSEWDFEYYRYRLLPTPPEEEYRSNPKPIGDKNFTPQPPLYYLLSIPLYGLSRSWPVLNQLYLLRLLSVLLLCATVGITYKLALQVFHAPWAKPVAVLAAASVALLPQYSFIGSSYNNDNLVPPLVTGALYLLIRGYRKQPASSSALIGAWVLGALALTAKRTAVGIVPVLLASTALYAWQWRRDSSRFHRLGTFLLAGLTLAALSAVVLILRPPVLPAALARALRLGPGSLVALSNQLSDHSALLAVDWGSLSSYILTSFLGQFGWLTLPVPKIWVYFFGFAALPITVGVVMGLIRAARTREEGGSVMLFAATISFIGIVSTLAAMIGQYLVAPAAYPPQGRYLFPFIAVIGLLAAWGWQTLWPENTRKIAVALALAMLVAFDIASWGFIIIPNWYV